MSRSMHPNQIQWEPIYYIRAKGSEILEHCVKRLRSSIVNVATRIWDVSKSKVIIMSLTQGSFDDGENVAVVLRFMTFPLCPS